MKESDLFPRGTFVSLDEASQQVNADPDAILELIQCEGLPHYVQGGEVFVDLLALQDATGDLRHEALEEGSHEVPTL